MTDFKRRTAQFVERLRKSGGPLVLTVNGRPEVVVPDPCTYQGLVRRLAELERTH